MTRFGHHVSGLLVGAAAMPWIASDSVGALCLMFGVYTGATAPDWLEVAWRDRAGKRKSLIPHRRITHWLSAWIVAIFAVIFAMDVRNAFWCAALGFACGGLLHLLCDIPNPMGVPVFHPWKRSSLMLWKSGEYEWLLLPLLGVLAFVSWSIA